MTNKTEDKKPDPVHNPHDAAFKSAFQKKEIARSFFSGFLPKKFTRHIDFNQMELVNKSYVDEAFREKACGYRLSDAYRGLDRFSLFPF